MALNSYAGLLTAIANWLHRADLTATIPDFITLAETRIYRGGGEPYKTQPLRISAMETATDPTSYTTTAGTATLALPDRFLEPRSLYLTSDPVQSIQFLPPQQFFTQYPYLSSYAKPRAYTIEGTNLRFGPVPDTSYGVRLGYYAAFDALSSTTTNWLTSNAPGLYLYGALIEALPYLKDDARASVWLAAFSTQIAGLNNANKDALYGSAPLVMRALGDNP